MMPSGVLLFVTLLPIQPGAGFVTAADRAPESRPAFFAAVPESGLASGAGREIAPFQSSGGTVKKRGWPWPAKLLVGEAAIATLSSVGYGGGDSPNEGATALGAVLIGAGGLAASIIPMGLADSNEKTRGEIKGALVGCGALMLAGGYNLILANNNDGGAGRIFRHNMVALNAVWLVTWGISSWRHWV
jgi:hypothetical protein